MKFVINTTKCDVGLFLHKMCCKMVWKFCEIWKSYRNWLPDGPNSVRFYLTVWDMACMINLRCCCFKNRHRNRKQFSQACFLFQGCLFKSSFEMWFMFKIVFPLKQTSHIFKTLNLLKWSICIFLKTILINCIFTLSDHRHKGRTSMHIITRTVRRQYSCLLRA